MRLRPRSPLASLVLVGLLLCAVLACKKKNEPSPATVARAAELEPKVTTRLAQIASLAGKVTDPGVNVTNEALAQRLTSANCAVVGEDFLVDPKAEGKSGKLELSNAALSVCKYILERTQVKDEDIQSLEACDRFEYAAVIRERSYTAPDVSGESTYSPGSFSGEVLVFHLPTSELRKRFSVDVSQDDTLELETKSKQKPPPHEWRQQATLYLQRHVADEVEEKLR